MPLQIPHPSTPLHLYRHLLRESSYLPTLCRPWTTRYIQQRFRDCRNKSPSAPFIKQAHSSLRYMRSTNAGHVKRLEHLCLIATGRVGKRRRILATSQLSYLPPTDTAGLERSRIGAEAESSTPARARDAPDPTHAAAALLREHDWLDNWSLDMISTLANSQLTQQTKNWPQTMRRTIDTKHITSGTNCFGRPFRPKLVRNKLKKHWAGVLKQLLPPLPKGEWDHLASLVQGDVSAEELVIPPRRPVARSVHDTSLNPASEPWDWTQHALKPARLIERGRSRKMKTLTGDEDQDPRGHGRPTGIKVIGPRRLQRIYGRVWSMSPTMKKGAGKKKGEEKWSVDWGVNEQKISAPSAHDLLFFQGVADSGKLVDKRRNVA